MPQPMLSIPGIEQLDLPHSRQSIGPLHTYLRECIIDGRIPPDTTLSQAGLAKQLGVSRTPLREVLRMLQEEGLVEAEPNRRMRVAGFDPNELDVIYSARILLESLAVAMTVGNLTAAQRKQAKAALTAMRRAARARDLSAWAVAHRGYHSLLASEASGPLRAQIRTLADRSERYIRIGQQVDPRDWSRGGAIEHPAILEALVAGDEPRAVALAAHHLERTARHVIAFRAPGYVPKAVQKAVDIVQRSHGDLEAIQPAAVAEM